MTTDAAPASADERQRPPVEREQDEWRDAPENRADTRADSEDEPSRRPRPRAETDHRRERAERWGRAGNLLVLRVGRLSAGARRSGTTETAER